MRSPGLKTHITVTLVLLLGTATLLAGLVITMFWQQSLIRSEAERVRSILATTSQALHAANLADQMDTPAFLAQVRESSGIDCLTVADKRGGRRVFTTGTCPNDVQLEALLKKSMQTHSPVAETSGSTWGVFIPRPEYLALALPLSPGQQWGGIGAATSLKPVYHRVRQKQKIIVAYLVINILLIATIGFFRLVKSTVKPVERLVRMTEQYNENNDFPLLPGQEGSEFSQLSAALNRMIQRIDRDRQQLRVTVASLEKANTRLKQTQEEMVRTEKLAAIGRLSAGLAHEIGNPISIIQGYLELLQRRSLSDDDRLQFAERAASELNRINQLIRQLLDFARSSPAGRQPVRINELLRDILNLFKARRKMERIHFQLDLLTENDLAETSEEGLRQVLLNCLLNAVDAVEEMGPEHNGEITVSSLEQTDETTQPSLVISIRDNGCGIDPAHLGTIFDPFFTTKEPGKGTGLGLSVSNTIIESLGGRLTVHSEPGRGTEIKIILPRS
jgi:hypothetical protein